MRSGREPNTVADYILSRDPFTVSPQALPGGAASRPELHLVEQGVIVRPMLTISQAVDLYVDGHLVDLGRAKRTRDSYGRYLDKFCDRFPAHWDVAAITEEDCRSFLALWANRSRGTRATIYAPLNGMFGFLTGAKFIKTNPMQFIVAPQRQRPEDLDVLTINPLDVPVMLREARPGTERNCLFILAGLGPRRHAAALLQLDDYDRRGGRMRFKEKGGKIIWKPVPAELGGVLEASIANREISKEQPYLIPPEGPLQNAERDDRIVWRVVKRVAGRCGIQAHTHALRRAFACFYLLENPGDSRGLQKLMGHKNPATTEVYVKQLDDALAMEPVRTLAWLGNKPLVETPQSAEKRFEASALVGAGGFEPPIKANPLPRRDGIHREGRRHG